MAASDPWIGRAAVRISADIVAMPIEREACTLRCTASVQLDSAGSYTNERKRIARSQ